jgi:hypothetical protein
MTIQNVVVQNDGGGGYPIPRPGNRFWKGDCLYLPERGHFHNFEEKGMSFSEICEGEVALRPRPDKPDRGATKATGLMALVYFMPCIPLQAKGDLSPLCMNPKLSW